MKSSMKLALVIFALVLTLSSVPAPALPSCCHRLCYYPNTCDDPCLVVEESQEYWTTCEAYLGGCDPF